MTKYTNALLSGCKNSADMKIRILSPILNNNFSNKKEFNQKITQIACDTGYSKRTLIRWYESYQKDGFEGLEPKYPKFRSDSRLYIRFEALKDEAKAMRMQDPTISVNNIIQCLESKHPNIRGIIKRSTLQRHLQDDGYSRKELLTENEQNGRAFYSRYKVAHRLIQVQGDIKEPPRGVCVDEQGFPVTPYVQIWMDNFSRKALTWKIHYHQTSDIALSSLRELIETYGIPEIILTDQGSIYRGAEIEHCTHVLGISHKRSKPYCPQSKGALERLNGTIDDLFRSIKLMKNVKFSMFCELVNQRLNEYNNTPHSALPVNSSSKHLYSPNEAFEKDFHPVRIAKQDILDYAFTISTFRKVSKDGLISFKGKKYRIQDGLAKARTMVRIDYSTTNQKVELVVRNSDEMIKQGAPEYSHYPLAEFILTPHIAYQEAMKNRISPEKERLKNNPPAVPAMVERLAREVCKQNREFVSEDQFQQNLLSNLTFNQLDSNSHVEDSDSVYATTVPTVPEVPELPVGNCTSNTEYKSNNNNCNNNCNNNNFIADNTGSEAGITENREPTNLNRADVSLYGIVKNDGEKLS